MEAKHNIKVEARLIKQFQDGRNKAFDELLKVYRSQLLAIAYSARWHYLGLSRGEAQSAAFYGFLMACRKFDTSSGRPFMAYGRYWVTKALREYNGRSRSIDAITVDNEGPSPSSIQKSDRQSLKIWLHILLRPQPEIEHFIETLPKNLQPVISYVLAPDGLALHGKNELFRKHKKDERELDRMVAEACIIFRNNRRKINVTLCHAP